MNQFILKKLVGENQAILISNLPQEMQENATLLLIGELKEPVNINIDEDKFKKEFNPEALRVSARVIGRNPLTDELQVKVEYTVMKYWKNEEEAKDPYRFSGYSQPSPGREYEAPYHATSTVTVYSTNRDRYGITYEGSKPVGINANVK